ncbi:PREDICTED: uncharacterized protein LOC105965654 [Erythranthe guttata]|uniref:uncharacterized protein LOC105965654 n=1 Tax=Erythranthe guttata TaxID=4155 RepID=UPI00064DCADC|nr:PREDICTED: uncharacterized protein LOC105965654 [Erythranthe guttata]|eukprot:XP_012845676.1 PREDICTED: uncharacterized protein LOC105965654 [Erythranthe guttata]
MGRDLNLRFERGRERRLFSRRHRRHHLRFHSVVATTTSEPCDKSGCRFLSIVIARLRCRICDPAAATILDDLERQYDFIDSRSIISAPTTKSRGGNSDLS